MRGPGEIVKLETNQRRSLGVYRRVVDWWYKSRTTGIFCALLAVFDPNRAHGTQLTKDLRSELRCYCTGATQISTQGKYRSTSVMFPFQTAPSVASHHRTTHKHTRHAVPIHFLSSHWTGGGRGGEIHQHNTLHRSRLLPRSMTKALFSTRLTPEFVSFQKAELMGDNDHLLRYW